MIQTSQHYLDLVFQGRNKDYGAYELRKNYSSRLYRSMIFTFLICAAVISLAFIREKPESKPVYEVQEVRLTAIKDEPEIPKEQPKKVKKMEPVQTVKYTAPTIVEDPQVKDPLPTVDQIEDSKIGVQNIEGKKDSNNIQETAPLVVKEASGSGENYEGEFKSVEIQASFPGGSSAWIKFLRQNLRGDIPVDNGAPSGTYTVVVSFLVDKDGSISQVEAVNDPGFGIAEEAVRVIRKSKVWNPAVQNNHKVTYRQLQKITFLVESGE